MSVNVLDAAKAFLTLTPSTPANGSLLLGILGARTLGSREELRLERDVVCPIKVAGRAFYCRCP